MTAQYPSKCSDIFCLCSLYLSVAKPHVCLFYVHVQQYPICVLFPSECSEVSRVCSSYPSAVRSYVCAPYRSAAMSHVCALPIQAQSYHMCVLLLSMCSDIPDAVETLATHCGKTVPIKKLLLWVEMAKQVCMRAYLWDRCMASM